MNRTGYFLAALLAAALAAIGRGETATVLDVGKTGGASIRGGAELVEDAAAPDGQAIRIHFPKGKWIQPLVVTRMPTPVAGPTAVRLWLRGEGLTGIARQVRFTVTFRKHCEDGTIQDYSSYALSSGVRLNAADYQPVPLEVRAALEPTVYEVIVVSQPVDAEMVGDVTVYLDRVEVIQAEGPRVLRVLPDLVAYAPGQAVTATVTLHNPEAEPFTGRLAVIDEFGLDGATPVAEMAIAIPAGATVAHMVRWQPDGPEAGHYVRARLFAADGAEQSQAGEYFACAEDPSYLATIPNYTAEMGDMGVHHALFIGMVSRAQSKYAVDFFTKVRRVPRREFMAWDANNLGGLVPATDPFVGGEGRIYQAWKQRLYQFRLFLDQGVEVAAYVNGNVWGIPAYELFKQHPEWFVYDREGQLHKYSPYDMALREDEQYPLLSTFKGHHSPFFYGRLNPTLPGTRAYMIGQIVHAARVVGFRSVRWDVWSMDLSPDDYDFFGRPIAGDWPTADRESAAALAAVKAGVRAEFPDFEWGYNMCAPEENVNTPLFLAEKCRDGGWMLDEVICSYQGKQSPYHYWEAYRDRIVGWGDQIRQRGGYYNPFAFRRGGGLYAVDRLYEGIIRLIGSGRAGNIYECNSTKVGELGHLAYRYSDVFLNGNLRLQPADQTLIAVAAPETLWWRHLVLANTSREGRPRAIVHLVNSPIVGEVEENPASAVRPPLLDVPVTCGKRDGRLPSRAWIVTAEPLLPAGEPAVQAVPADLRRDGERVALTVPSVLYWKTIVFEY